jgi:hypothetical protein
MIKETRKLYRASLVSLCIKRNWYTRGTQEEYDKLLSIPNKIKNVKASHIWEIANNIKNHSITEQTIDSIAFDIAQICNSWFEEK